MNPEYIIINKTAIQQRIEEWETELQECFKAPVGEFNSKYVSGLRQAIATARDFLSQSTPLIPEIEKAFDESRRQDSWAGGHLYGDGYNEEEDLTDFKYKTSKNYISNLKLDI